MRPKFKVGLLLDNDVTPAWVAHLSELIAGSEYAEVVLVLVHGQRGSSTGDVSSVWALTPRSGLLRAAMSLYRGIVDRSCPYPDPWSARNAEVLADVERIDLSRDKRAALSAAERHGVDVWLRCGLKAVPSAVIASAPLGAWSLEPSPADRAAVVPAGFCEPLDASVLTWSVLTGTDGDGACSVLYESVSSTQPFSVTANVARYYWKALHFVPRVLQAMYRSGAQGPEKHVASPEAAALLKDAPTTSLSGAYCAWATCRAIGRKLKTMLLARLFVSDWAMQRSAPFDDGQPLALGETFENPDDGFLADPHLARDGGRTFLFYEEFDRQLGRGHISVRELDGGNDGVPEQPILKRPYHLSYPFVFEHGGEYYMIPESCEAGRVELCRAMHFPLDWQHERFLLEDVHAADSTLLQHGGKWWLFATLKQHPAISSWDELFLFHADDLLAGEWTAHPQNPIVSDCRAARPAGAIFRRGERLIRPSQESGRIYGSGLNFFEITELSETRYSERLIRTEHGRTADNAIGIHSYAECGDVAVVDQFVRRPRWSRR